MNDVTIKKEPLNESYKEEIPTVNKTVYVQNSTKICVVSKNEHNSEVNVKEEITSDNEMQSSFVYEKLFPKVLLEVKEETVSVPKLCEKSEEHTSDSHLNRPYDTSKNSITTDIKFPKKYTCWICTKKFLTPRGVKKHILTHKREGNFVCPVCDGEFPNHSFMKGHMSTHERGKPFSCELCQKRFTKFQQVKVHYLTHTKEKPFSCDICCKKFKVPQALRKHVQNLHSVGSTAAIKTLLKQENHQLQISDSKSSYICDICGRKFKSANSLHQHSLYHEKALFLDDDEIAHLQGLPTKPSLTVKQDYQGLRFQVAQNIPDCDSNSLKKFSCAVCQQLFLNQSQLSEHLLKHEKSIETCLN